MNCCLPQLVTSIGQWGLAAEDHWVEAIVPFRFSRGDAGLLLLGRRAGGRRYLSEDLQNLTQLSFVVTGQVERAVRERCSVWPRKRRCALCKPRSILISCSTL